MCKSIGKDLEDDIQNSGVSSWLGDGFGNQQPENSFCDVFLLNKGRSSHTVHFKNCAFLKQLTEIMLPKLIQQTVTTSIERQMQDNKSICLHSGDPGRRQLCSKVCLLPDLGQAASSLRLSLFMYNIKTIIPPSHDCCEQKRELCM